MQTLKLFAAWIIIALGFLLGSLPLFSPDPPEQVPADSLFSTQRAFIHLEEIAAAPRPTGSKAHLRVRNYLVDRLGELGLRVTLQEGFAMHSPTRRYPTRVAFPRNIVGKSPHPNPDGKYLLLLSHYDSVPNSPGAADDGLGLVTILETVRALSAGSDGIPDGLMVLFTDAEEVGLLGAQAFMDDHPLADSVAMVINIEARGTAGPTLMFETSGPVNPLLGLLAAGNADVITNSLTATVYRYLPNDTDFSPFLRAGIPGMNFSIIDNHPAYHNVLDNPANLDLGSLRQTGEAVLGVTRAALAQMPPPHSRPTAYFTLPGGMLIRYPVFVQHLAAVLIVVLWLFLIRIHPDRNEILKRGLFSQILLTVIPLVVIPALLGFLFNQLMPSLFSPEGYRYFYWENPLLAFTMLQALVLQTLFYLRWLTKGLVWEIWLGQLGFLALLNLGLSLWVPEAFFFLTWPLIFILMGTLLSMLLKCFRLGDGHSCLLIAQFAVPGILILLPLIYLVHIALSLHLVAVSLMVAMILSFILLPFWMPILSKHRLFLAFLATISLLGPLLIRFSAKPSADRPQPEYLAYIADSQSPKAFWLARETGSDWQEVFFANRDKVRIPEDLNILWPGQKGLAKAANAVALSGPAAEILQRDSAETTLRLFSTRGAPNMQIQVVRGSIEKIGGPDGRWHAAGAALQAGKTVRFYNLPDSGLVLGGPGGQTLQLSVFDQSYDLPAGAPQLPEGSMHHRTGNATWCRSTFLWAF